MSKAEQLIACLEGEIAKRDEELAACRVAVENCEVFRARIAELEARIVWLECEAQVNTAPVSEAKAQGEYGDAYQGAREGLAIWKRRALEAEEKVRQQEQIIDHLTSEAQGESRFGEPVVTPDAPCVPDGYVLADKKALGTVLQALVNAPHHIRELQVTRQPVELFSDNPINVLIANYEAPAAPAAPAADAGLDVVAWRIGFPNNAGYKVYAQRQPWAYEQYGVPSVIVYEVQELCRLSDTHAIIDGLLGDVAEQEEAANQWRELALQFDRHRMTAMAHIRAAASGDKSAIEALGVFAALPPIPGHEITAAHERQAQRIDKLEGLLRDSAELIKHGVFEDGICCCGSSVDSHGFGDGHSPVDALAYHAGQVCERIDAALSAGKEVE